MQKWEYKTAKISRNTGFGGSVSDWSAVINLNELGKEGWELVAVVPIASSGGESFAGLTTSVSYFFKRAIE